MATGFEEIDAVLDPAFEIAEDFEPELSDILPKGYLSISQATKFIKCGFQWKLVYVDQKPQRTNARMFQGVHVHTAVEGVLNHILETGQVPPVEMAMDTFADAFEANKLLIQDWEGETPGDVKDTGITCAKVFHTDVAATSTPITVEKTFRTIIKSADGKIRLPILGRIDSEQVIVAKQSDYEQIRKDFLNGKRIINPMRIHDLKVSTDKWSVTDLENDIQFATYAHVEGIPDVQVDNISKGRAKLPRPKYNAVNAVMDPGFVKHSISVLEDVAKSIGLGHFPKTDPSNWWCSGAWCSVWQYCRGATNNKR